MAITFEGFSIREYASKIRDTNVEKCWPFDGNPNEMEKEVVEELLPPITCKKWKWWCHELEKVVGKSEVVLQEKEEGERLVMSCPVCLSFKASTVNAISVHIDSCLRKERKKMKLIEEGGAKAKSKQPKKKSITEIFAVSPQIEDVGLEDQEEEEDEDRFKQENLRVCGIIARVNRKKRKSKEKTIAKKGSCLKKEKALKFKSSIKLGLVGKVKSSINGKKLTAKIGSSRQSSKMKTIRASKMNKHSQVATGNPIHSILKKFTSVPKISSSVGNTWGGQVKPCHPFEKHVRFSGKGSIHDDSFSSEYLINPKHSNPHFISDSMVLSSVNHQLEKWDNISLATDEMADVSRNSEDTRITIMEGAAVQSNNENERLSTSDGQILLLSSRKCSDWNRAEKGEGLRDESSRFSGDVICQADATMPMRRSGATSSLTKRREADRRDPFHTEETSQNLSRFDLQYRPSLEQSPKDLMTSTVSLVDQKQRKAAMLGSKFIDDDFIGLPLNSQGELIKLHSSGIGGSHQLKKQNMMNAATNSRFPEFVQPESTSINRGKIDCFVEAAVPKDRFELVPEYNSLEILHIPSEVGNTELRSTGRTDMLFKDSNLGNNYSVQQLGLDLNQMNFSSCRCSQSTKKHNQTQKEKIIWVESEDGDFLPTTQPTMRLMGRDVTVGIKDKKVHASDDDKIWTDKNVIKEHFPPVEIENPSLGRNFQMEATANALSGMLKEKRNQSLECQGNHTTPYLSQMKDIGLCLDQTYSNWKPNQMRKSGPQLIAEDQRVQMHPFSCPVMSRELMSRNPKTLGTSIYGAEHPTLSCQTEPPTSSQYPCQCMQLNCSQHLQNQGLHCATSRFQFPFDTQVFGQCMPPSQSWSSSSNLPYWMLNTSQQKENPVICSGYDVNGVNNQYSGSRSNSSGILFPYGISMVSPPNHHDSSLARAQGSSGTYLIQRPLIPVPPGLKPTSAINTGYKYRLNKNKMKPHLVHRKDSNLSTRTKKRPADKTNCSVDISKKPTLEIPLDPANGVEIEKEVTSRGKHTSGVAESCTTRGTQHSLTEIYKDASVISPGVCSSNLDGMARLGPVKLSAGAKHILKPSLNTDKDDSRPIHSTIPFGSVTDASKDSELQNNQARIYRL